MLAIRSTTSSYTHYRNAGQLQATTAYSPPTFTKGKFHVGYRHTGGGNPHFYGDITEALNYGKAVTTEERQRVENYLVSKYSISFQYYCSESVHFACAAPSFADHADAKCALIQG
jgi:hypothetical protein